MMAGDEVAKPGMSLSARLFVVAATIEGLTWLGLLIGMYLKYVTGTPDHGVPLFGRLHGGAFVLYLVATLLAAHNLRWPWWATGLALVAAVPPLVTLPLEIWYRRRGLLGPRRS